MSKIQKYLILFISAILAVFFIIVFCVTISKKNAELRRLRANYEVLATNSTSIQQNITRRELKEYFDRQLNELNKYGVRTRNIENIVEISYQYRDTLIYRDTLVFVYDTLKNYKFSTFDICTPCWSVFGKVVGDTIEVYDVSVNDDIIVSLYKEKKKCLFEKRKVKAIAISSCNGDTLKILRNLRIEN